MRIIFKQKKLLSTIGQFKLEKNVDNFYGLDD